MNAGTIKFAQCSETTLKVNFLDTTAIRYVGANKNTRRVAFFKHLLKNFMMFIKIYTEQRDEEHEEEEMADSDEAEDAEEE